MSKVKKFLIASLSINLIAIICVTVLFFQKGGLNYIKLKLNPDVSVNAKHIQRDSLFSELNIKNDDIVFLGDSISQRCEWAELFNMPNIKNRAIDGDTIQETKNIFNYVIKEKPKKIFIMTGINDVINNKKDTTYVLNEYEAMLQNKNKETQIYLQSILPVGKKYNANKTIKDINDGLRSLADKYNCTYIDLYSSMVSSEGYLKDNLTEDELHLKGEGYIMWRDLISKYII